MAKIVIIGREPCFASRFITDIIIIPNCGQHDYADGHLAEPLN